MGVQKDLDLNYFDKQSQKNRIDPVDAIIDAWKIMLINKKETVNNDEAVEEWLDLINKRR